MRHYLIEEKYDYIGVFHEGLALARFGDYRAGYIDKTGKPAVPLKYDFAQNFSEGLAAVRIKDRWAVLEITDK